jgi:exosortase A-associated hydrolase 2
MPAPASARLEPFFLPVEGQARFCIHHAPAGPVRGAVLFVHAWAEEMNKSRRMAALTSRALAATGHAVLQIDLLGCGDSGGDFAQATWTNWVNDVRIGAAWLQQRHPGAPLCLWGQRAGALLAVQAAATLPPNTSFLFWQPPTAGKPLLQQFLRLKAAAEMQQGDAKATLEKARADLAGGRCVSVAGYELPPALASGLEAATLDLPHAAAHVHWLETNTREPAALLPVSMQRVEAWRAAGHEVSVTAVSGPAFWQTQEIEDAPALAAATVAAMTA